MTVSLPRSWVAARFGEIISAAQNGCGTRTASEGVPTVVIRLADVNTSGLVSSDGLRHINLSDVERHKYSLLTGDLLVFRVNGSRSIAGQVMWYPGPDGYAYCDHFIRVRLRQDVANTRFVGLAFRTPVIRNAVEKVLVSSAGQHTISQGSLADLELPIPPLNEQRRIVEKIDALFAHSKKAKESLDRIPALLEKLKKSILAAAFRGDLTKDWREAHPDVEPADQLLARIRTERRRRWEEAELAKMRAKGKEPKDDKWKAKYDAAIPLDGAQLPSLPPGWIWTALGEIVEPLRNGVPEKPAEAPPGVPILRISSVRPLSVDLNNRRYLRAKVDLSNYWILDGDLLFTRYNGTLSLVGVCGVARGVAEQTTYPDKLIRARSIEIHPEIIALAAASDLPRRFLESKAKTTSGQQGISGADLSMTPIPLPPAQEQVEIVDRVLSGLSMVEVAAGSALKCHGRLARLTEAILARAFRGELVPQDPNDEDASVLLDRIRAERASTNANPSKTARRARIKGKDAAGNASPPRDPEQVPPRPTPVAGTQPAFRFDADFLQASKEVQAQEIADAIFGHGPLTKDEAIKRAAEYLRSQGLADFQRLRSGGELHTAITTAIETALKLGLLDRPARGQVRATKVDPQTYLPEDWSLCVAATLNGEAVNEDDAIRRAANWAAENLGLEFKRLRPGGVIHAGLTAALRQARQRDGGPGAERRARSNK